MEKEGFLKGLFGNLTLLYIGQGFYMERFDVLVIVSGSGMIIASTAVENGYKPAMVDKGPMGGTCLNVGCVPSKMLIYPADVIAMFNEAQALGVHGTITSVDFK